MRQFFKFILASCLGSLLAILVIVGLFALVGTIMSAGNTGLSKGSVLLLEFDQPIPERSGNVPTQGFSLETMPSTGLHDIVRLIKKARTDNSISGIVYKTTGSVALGTVKASTIREALKEFRDSTDKFVYAYGDYFDNTSYLLASSADSIFTNPMGMLDVNGNAAMIPFFKGAMDKLGVDMNVFYAGQFKSATEPFRRTDMSEQNKQQTREYLSDNFELYLEEVAESRQISKVQIRSLINELDFDNTQDALEKDLVDGLWHWYEVEDHLRKKLGLKEGGRITYVDIEEYASNTSLRSGISKNKIAVIYAEGEVVYNNDQRGNINEKTYHKVFDKIRRDKKIKAIVLRVNSPGGSAFTSDVIWKELKELQAQGIPLIASFGDYAASGGYYIAANADTIVSHPKTLTGSIGVFSMMPNFTELMEDKLGITFDTVKTSPHAIVMSPFYDIGNEESAALQGFTDNMYQTFLSRVAEGRKASVEDVDKVAQGRVWTGQRALEKGLVDELGGLDRAIELAAESAGVDEYKLVEYPVIKKEFWEDIMNEINKQNNALMGKQLSQQEKKIYSTFQEFRQILRYKEPLARLPFLIQN